MTEKTVQKRILALLALCVYIVISVFPIRAAEAPPRVFAETYILYEPDRDMILFAKDESRRIYPASMTKILTAILAEEYIDLDEIVIVGNEIDNIPGDSSRAYHEVGEAITGENILRGLIIPSGNETACIVAMYVAREISGDPDISYKDAEKLFCDLMNERARELGALDTHFTNPHGYHAGSHYTTAYDLAMITAAALESEVIMRLALETSYVGPSAVTNDDSLKIVEHSWPSHNKLVMAGAEGYAYATGLKTGYTDDAGECLAATATKDGANLIAIVCNSPADMRWADVKELFEYGYNAFTEHRVQEDGITLGTIEVSDPRLGDETTLTYYAVGAFDMYLNTEQIENIVRDVTIDKARIAPPVTDEETGETDSTPRILAPITEGEVIGSVAYSLKGEILFTGEVVAGRTVEERTYNTDMDFYIAELKAAAFSVKAIPYWIAGILVPILIIVLIVTLVRRSRRRNSGRYHFNSRRW